MAFTPEKPQYVDSLWAQLDPELDEVVTLFYRSDEGLFYREDGNWNEMTGPTPEEDENDEIYFIDSKFISVYDESEKAGDALGVDALKEYIKEYKVG
jgi:hypothetical protein